MAQVVMNGEQIASGSTVYGQVVKVFKNTYRPPLPGLGETGFSVSVSGMPGQPSHSAGFVSIEDVKAYLHGSGSKQFRTFNVNGDEVMETRECLGVPRGMVSDIPDDTSNVE